MSIQLNKKKNVAKTLEERTIKFTHPHPIILSCIAVTTVQRRCSSALEHENAPSS